MYADDAIFIQVMDALNNVSSKWDMLSLLFGVSSADVDHIKQNNPRDAESKEQAIVRAWILTQNASWANLVSALRHKLVKMNAYGNQIARSHPS